MKQIQRHVQHCKWLAFLAGFGLLPSCVGDIGSGSGAQLDPTNANCSGEATFGSRAPIRRLTKFEYNNTIEALLGDKTSPANLLPSEEIGNGFGNDSAAQSVSSLLVEQYNALAEGIAKEVVSTPNMLSRLAPCGPTITNTTDRPTEDACVRSIVENLASQMYRRPADATEVDELVALQQQIRTSSDFSQSIAAVIEAMLQSPEYLYHIEFGQPDADGRLRPTDYEMASRLSYMFWGAPPDEPLLAAAAAGRLQAKEDISSQAERLLDHDRSRRVIRFFFDGLLPISGLNALERDSELYPTFSSEIGALMHEEVQRFLEYEIFEGSGTWSGALTAPYTFVNEPLANYYNMSGVSGDAFQKVPLDTSQRLGLLTQGGVLAGSIHSNMTNPVVRGAFIVKRLMCKHIPLPTGDTLLEVKPPDPDSGKTNRERYAAHAEDPTCRTCHQFMDPVGLAFENFDPVGLWRDTENGVVIDASGTLPGTGTPTEGPVDLVRKIAEAEDTHACFASKWANFAYGRTLSDGDSCLKEALSENFGESGFDIKKLLVALTQTEAFLYLPEGGD